MGEVFGEGDTRPRGRREGQLIRFFATEDCLRQGTAGFVYRIAGQALWFEWPMQVLNGYVMQAPASAPQREPCPGVEPDAPEVTVTGWLAGANRRVTCRYDQSVYELDLTGLMRLVVTRTGNSVYCRATEQGLKPAVLEEAVLGPPITIALALQDIWCLHASALVRDGQAILFLGASGRGKSTLAAYCRSRSDTGFHRITDDIVPCALIGSRACAMPHFPQLKLCASDQYSPDAPVAVPMKAILILRPTLDSPEIAIEPLPSLAGVKALIDQTVAVGLFDRVLHLRHLRFLAALSGLVPVYQLLYPHNYGCLPKVYRALAGL